MGGGIPPAYFAVCVCLGFDGEVFYKILYNEPNVHSYLKKKKQCVHIYVL